MNGIDLHHVQFEHVSPWKPAKTPLDELDHLVREVLKPMIPSCPLKDKGKRQALYFLTGREILKATLKSLARWVLEQDNAGKKEGTLPLATLWGSPEVATLFQTMGVSIFTVPKLGEAIRASLQQTLPWGCFCTLEEGALKLQWNSVEPFKPATVEEPPAKKLKMTKKSS